MTVSMKPGDSVAVNGVCLTVSRIGEGSFEAVAVGETRKRTCFERLSHGAPLNLERPLRAGDRLDGHLVQGHVDGVGEIVSLRREGGGKSLTVRHPDRLDRYIVEKGSIALDGTSLTVAGEGDGLVRTALVPVTLEKTAFGLKRRGDPVHIEVDLIGKYVEKMLRRGGNAGVAYREIGYE